MSNFYKKVDDMVQEILSGPILSEIYQESQNLLSALKKSQIEKDNYNDSKNSISRVIIKNSLILKGYSLIQEYFNNEDPDLIMSFENKIHSFKVMSEYEEVGMIPVQIENNNNIDYFAYLIASRGLIGFIKPNKIDELLKTGLLIKETTSQNSSGVGLKNYIITFSDFENYFKIIHI